MAPHHFPRSNTHSINFDNLFVPIPRINVDEERSIIYWWALTQLTGFALYRIFLFVYASFPDSENGHRPIRSYMESRNLSHLLRYFNPMSYDENKKLISDPNKLFLDISFINKAFRNIFTANSRHYHVVAAIGAEMRLFNDERNLLSHNRLPSNVGKENLEVSLETLNQRVNRLCNLATELNPQKSYEMEELSADISKEFKLLKSQSYKKCRNCDAKREKLKSSKTLYFPRI